MPLSVQLFNLVFMMSFNVYHLRKTEVKYELKLRGASTEGTANDLRRRLSQSLARNLKIQESVVAELDVEEEFDVCEDKLNELTLLVTDYEGDKQDEEYKRLNTRLWHLQYRVDRIPVEIAEAEAAGSTSQDRKITLFNKTKALIDTFAVTAVPKLEENIQTPPSLNPTNLVQTEVAVAQSVPPVVNHRNSMVPSVPSASVPNTQIINYPTTFQGQSHRGKSIPVFKWGLKFDADNNYSVGAFLDRVEELRRARGVSQQELFESAVDLFTGTALIWYRSTINRVNSWDQLCKELKLVFQSPDYDDRLRQEIRNRYQGPEESIDLFLAAMDGLYGRLSEVTSEKERLGQALKNLNPYLQEKLCMFDINSLESLRTLGRKAELGRLRTSEHFPSKTSRVLEPDLAWGNNRKKSMHVASVNTLGTPRSATKCWNCSQSGHRFSQCPKPKTLFCYKCGTAGFRKSDCPRCNPKNEEKREPAQ